MTRITDDLGQSTDYAYDERGRLSLTTYADSGTVATCYAFGSSPYRVIDQRNITKRFDYDGLGRLLTKGDKWTSADIVERYEYDAGGRRTLAILTDGGTEKADDRYYYTAAGRLTRESQQIAGGTTRNVDMLYNKAGGRTKLTYPQAKDINYTYDALNRVSRISDGANARAVYNYIGPARLKQKTLLNGASTVSTYKLLYNGVANITSALYRNAGDTATIIGYEHGYDKVGNPLYEIRTHQSSEGDAYLYDNLYRVTRTIYDDANPTSPTYASARTDDWLLDDIGNRTKIYAKSATPTEYEHNAVNEYTSVGGTGYEYDAAGNLTKDDTHYYYWDYENRLTKVELVDGGADVAAYTYDANNRRVEKLDYTADPDETTQYFYNAWSCIEEREDDGTLLATYINGPRIDEYILMSRDSTDYWYMQSPIVGNVAALVNSSGEIQEGYKYRAYGAATVLTGAGNDTTWFTSDDDTATTSSIGNPYTFTGRRLDPETMLMYFRNRMYEPETGAFISRDPIGYVDGMSLYLGYFVPGAADPLGLWTREGVLKILCADVKGKEIVKNVYRMKIKVYTFDKRTRVVQEYEDAAMTKKKGGPVTYSSRGRYHWGSRTLMLRKDFDDKTAASVFFHEGIHAQQHSTYLTAKALDPESAVIPKKSEREYEAHIEQEKFHIRNIHLGIPPMDPTFRAKDDNDNWYADEDAIKQWVDENYQITGYWKFEPWKLEGELKPVKGPWCCPGPPDAETLAQETAPLVHMSMITGIPW